MRYETMRYNEIPSDDEVVSALDELGGRATAAVLCDRLAQDHPRRDCQLAIQRAAERGRLQWEHDWALTITKEVVAA